MRSPNGGECLRAGDDVLITWAREGEVGDEVVLEYNTDGSTGDFPLPIGDGPVENSGSFTWSIPHDLSPTCRLRIRSVGRPLFDISDGLFSIENRCAIRALIWVPYVPTGAEQVIGVLQAIAQHEPDFEPSFSTVDTPEALRGDLEGKDAMVIPRQKRGHLVDFDELGRTLAPVLREFIASGGALVVCQQTSRVEPFLLATGLLEFTRQEVGTRLCEVIDPFHPLARGIRSNFGGPISTSWYDIPSTGVDRVVHVGEGQTVVAARGLGFGRLSFLGYDYYNFNDDTARILANGLRVVLPDAGIRLTSPNPGEAFQAGQQVPIRWFALGEARGPVALYYGTEGRDGDITTFITEEETEEDGRGTFFWTAPTPPEGEIFLEVHLRVESQDVPEYSDTSEEAIYVVRPLTIETDVLPEANVGLEYEALIRILGGVPPYKFSVDQLPTGLVLESPEGLDPRIIGVPQTECPNCEVFVHVEDSIGLETEKYLPLSVVTRGIRILEPDEGELLLFGSPFQISWRTTGLVGETATLSYNLTGDESEFPRLIASSVSLAEGSHVWSVPGVTTETARLKIESEQYSEIATVSELFSIVGPTIRVSIPNGGECWQPGSIKRVRWRSVGNNIGTIRLEYNTDGSPDEFPHVVAENLPNTGEYIWVVPDSVSASVQIRATFENAPDIAAVSDDVFSIGPDCGLRIAIWRPCPVSDEVESNIVQAIEERVAELETVWTVTRDPSRLEPLLINRDALVVPLMSICQTLEYENLGSSFESVLTEYVGAGGVVVFCAPSSFSSRVMAGLGLLDRLRLVTSRGGLPSRVTHYMHPIVTGVPLDFEGPFSTSAYTFFGSDFEMVVEGEGASVVAALDQGLGRWVVLGFNFVTTNEPSARLLTNSVQMRAIPDGLRIISPRPGQVFSSGDVIPIEWVARGERSGLVSVRYNRTGALDSFPLKLAQVESASDGGSMTWGAPAPPPGEHLTMAFQVSWVEEPEVRATSEGPFFVTERSLVIETEELPAGRLNDEYTGAITVSGGVPPYSFDATPLPSGLFLTRPDGMEPTAPIRGVPLETVTDHVFWVQVTGALGSVAEATYLMKVLPSRLILLTPGGAEFLLAGSTYEVTWEIRGNVGETVRVEYNLTGASGSDEFDHVATEAAPAGEPFLWTVPETLSEHCRMRIRSNEYDQESLSARTFAITGPGITCLFPNGSEALDTGSTRTIRWRSLGNPGERVDIDLLLDGTVEGERIPVAVDVPDTGTYSWTVPDVECENCSVLVRSTVDLSLIDESDEPFVIRFNNPVRGLIWIPFTSHERLEVRGAVAAITNYEFDFDWRLSSTRDPELLRRELLSKETFLMVQQERHPEVSFGARGREMGPVLEEFAERGGTVVILKQQGGAREFLPATGLLEATEVAGELDVECQVAFPEHPVVNLVPSTFRPGAATSWYDILDEDADVFVTYEGSPVVAGRDIGDGRVVLVGFDYRDYTPDAARLLANAARMVRFTERTPFVRGDANADGRINIIDPVFILNYLFRNGQEPVCLDAADVDDSASVGSTRFPITLHDAISLLRWLFLGDRPPLAPSPLSADAIVLSCGFEARERDGLDCEAYWLCE